MVTLGESRYYVKNPLHQNYEHVKYLMKILGLSRECFISFVCITSSAKVNIKSDNDVRNYTLINKIYSYNDKKIENCRC